MRGLYQLKTPFGSQTIFNLGQNILGGLSTFGALEGSQGSVGGFEGYGALLGCEVVGGLFKSLGRSDIARTKDPHAIMVRYVFLVPPNADTTRSGLFRGVGGPGPSMPQRERIERQMERNMGETSRNVKK